jgi:hypothetical protein
LSGYEKDKIRKRVGHNHLTGSEMDSGRATKTKALEKKKTYKDEWSAHSGKKVGVRFEYPNSIGRGTKAFNTYGRSAKAYERTLKKEHGEHYSRTT